MQILIEQVLDADHNKIFLATESYCPTLLKHCCSVACKWGIKYKLIHSNLFRWICNRLYTSKTSGTISTEQKVCCKQNWWTSQINVQDIFIDNLLTSIHELVTLCSFFDNTLSGVIYLCHSGPFCWNEWILDKVRPFANSNYGVSFF